MSVLQARVLAVLVGITAVAALLGLAMIVLAVIRW